jgi:hypothetical protein
MQGYIVNTKTAFGATVAGSNLSPGCTYFFDGGLYVKSGGSGQSGTWQQMGSTDVFDNTDYSLSTYVRIA